MQLYFFFHQEHRKIAHAQAALQCCHQVGILRQSSSQYNHKIYSILAAHPWFTCLSFILALQLHRQGQPNQFLRGKSLWALPPRPPPCLARLATFLPGEAPSLWARCPAPACSPPASHLRSPQPVVSWKIYVYCRVYTSNPWMSTQKHLLCILRDLCVAAVGDRRKGDHPLTTRVCQARIHRPE